MIKPLQNNKHKQKFYDFYIYERNKLKQVKDIN